jgi:hypothetical protein
MGLEAEGPHRPRLHAALRIVSDGGLRGRTSNPMLASVPGAHEHVVPIQPVSFSARGTLLCGGCKRAPAGPCASPSLGGGATGVEVVRHKGRIYVASLSSGHHMNKSKERAYGRVRNSRIIRRGTARSFNCSNPREVGRGL